MQYPMFNTFAMSSVVCRRADHAAHPTSDCHYQIAWSINPHMKPGTTRLGQALNQHEALRRILRKAGAQILELPFVCGAYDSVFAKDNAFLFQSESHRRALVLNPTYIERQQEQATRERAYETLGFELLHLPESVRLEGGDIVVAGQRGVFLGYGFRSDRAVSPAFSELTGWPTEALELVDPYLYHLDTALAFLSDGTALGCREAFSEDSWARLSASPWLRELIEVSYEDALNFGCNVVQVGRQVVSGCADPGHSDRLRGLGYEPVTIPLSQFTRAGGSAACMVAQVHVAPSAGLDLLAG